VEALELGALEINVEVFTLSHTNIGNTRFRHVKLEQLLLFVILHISPLMWLIRRLILPEYLDLQPEQQEIHTPILFQHKQEFLTHGQPAEDLEAVLLTLLALHGQHLALKHYVPQLQMLLVVLKPDASTCT